NVREHTASLGIDRVPKLGEGHPPATLVEEGISRLDLDEWVVALGKGAETPGRIESWLEHQVREYFPRGPFAWGVGPLQVRLHALKLPAQIAPRRIDASLKFLRRLAGHEFPPRMRRAWRPAGGSSCAVTRGTLIRTSARSTHDDTGTATSTCQ